MPLLLVMTHAAVLFDLAESLRGGGLQLVQFLLQTVPSWVQQDGQQVQRLHVGHEAEDGVSSGAHHELLKVPADVRGLDGVPERLFLWVAGVTWGWALGLGVDTYTHTHTHTTRRSGTDQVCSTGGAFVGQNVSTSQPLRVIGRHATQHSDTDVCLLIVRELERRQK